MAVLAPPLAERFDRLLRPAIAKNPSMDQERVRRAFSTAAELYGDERHWTGLPLLEHALSVLEQLLAFDPDEDAIVACLLEHALRTEGWSLEDIEREFGAHVREIVGGAHLLGHVTMSAKRMTVDQMRLMFLRISDDPRVVLLVLCRKAVALDHLGNVPDDERRRFCRDVLSIFAPVAARLGIYTLKHHFERGAFPVAYPTDSQRIDEQMRQIHARYGDFLRTASESLMRYLRDEGVPARVDVREKQSYSIFRKMREKSVTHVEDLYDLFALRVIVQSEMECYQVLGLLHRIGHPIVNRFKDYIAFPKPNGYQSLHTTLAHLPGSPDWVFVEVQVRTEAMHREAEYGIAAHWSYKEGGAAQIAAERAHLQKVLQAQQAQGGGHLLDHIFVLTPHGDVIELPEGASPLDFAFHVHTDLGLSFKAARVNGAIAPLDQRLENGDIVEIVKHKDPRPSAGWITHLKTASARSRLRKYLAAQDRPTHVAAGRDLVNEELRSRGQPPLDHELSILKTIDGQELGTDDREELLAKVGQGTLRPSSLLQRTSALKALVAALPARRSSLPAAALAAAVTGVPMPIRYAKCCKAEHHKGKDITGLIGRDGKVRVHLSGCKMLRGANKEREVRVRWQ